MFDPISSDLLRSAPRIGDLDPSTLPKLLTEHYVRLISIRLGVEDSQDDTGWTLERIADAYEIVATTVADQETRRAAAFVAASAQQVLSRRPSSPEVQAPIPNVSRDGLNSSISACLLFLLAEQYADASEAAAFVSAKEGDSYESGVLAELVKNLARGDLGSIVRASSHRATPLNRALESLEDRAFAKLLSLIADGVVALAQELLGLSTPELLLGARSSSECFRAVIEWSKPDVALEECPRPLGSYAGSLHLAHLLLVTGDILSRNCIATLAAPPGADSSRWQRWIAHRAASFPFVWPNHKEFISKKFHYPGRSAVLVLPTGAGKTTVSALKIAATICAGKRVVFLAPTHALAEQLTDDLREMFPQSVIESTVSSDFDLPEAELSQVPTVEVMTPEGCLASMAYSPERYADVGLLVFDECHLLSPSEGSIRRSIDGMLCILSFLKLAPEADLLLLSAMLLNGDDLAKWISSATGRECIPIDLLWKPSRQARGIVAYDLSELRSSKGDARAIQAALDRRQGKSSPNLRAPALREIQLVPHALWGLQHNWLAAHQNEATVFIHKVLDRKVQLGATLRGDRILETPNSNSVAAAIAIEAAKQGLKTIVFVNNKTHAVKTAREIAAALSYPFERAQATQERFVALEAELGSLKHSVLHGLSSAVPHNASMFRLERDIAERLYKQVDGARVIVATPTLAQGLNLPAQLAILAGDKRMDGESRVDLGAHEILNAAARAGRAGHLANGLVLLIPEPVITFSRSTPLSSDALRKLESLLPLDDRCVLISDPLEQILDNLTVAGYQDADVRYVINRMAASMLSDTDGDGLESTFDLDRSFMAFQLRAQGLEQKFQDRAALLSLAIAEVGALSADRVIARLASQTGLDMEVLDELRRRLQTTLGALPNTTPDWLTWMFAWLIDSEPARAAFLGSSASAPYSCSGEKRESGIVHSRLIVHVVEPTHLWISGACVADIELALGGNPHGGTDTERLCPRARELITTVIGRGFAYAASVIALIVVKLKPTEFQEDFSIETVETLSVAVRRGFDRHQKLKYSQNNPDILSRVLVHKAFAENEESLWGDLLG